jgi:hypothetical protein
MVKTWQTRAQRFANGLFSDEGAGSLRSCLDLFQLVFDKYFAAADVLS